MLNLRSTIQYPALTFLITLGVLFFFYHAVLLHPNDYLFASSGDGIKNYYVYLYHAQFDTNFHDFMGMNYPYYEHIVYADAHPLLTAIIKQLGLAPYGVGILNLLMLFSYPVAAIFLYQIFRHYKVNPLWAIPAAVAITFMSPQVFRLTGHFSMAYVFAVPIMWWLLIKSYQTGKWLWSVAIGCYLIIFFFTHPYLGIILAFFSIVFWLVEAIANREHIKRNIFKILVEVAVPFMFFQGFIWLTDTHVNRLSNPAGFFSYYASWKSVLLPHHGPLSSLVSFFKINLGTWEAWSYIGFATLVYAAIILAFLFRKRQSIAFKSLLRSELVLFLIAAWLILLFAFCFPLKYSWLRWITDLFGPLKQFRILGRFTWIFFYVFTVASVVGIYRIYLKEKKPFFPVIFFGGIVFFGFEFYPVHQQVSEILVQTPNEFERDQMDPKLREVADYIKQEGYDAILFLPFHHISSENIMLLGAEKANHDSFLLSYHTQRPTLNALCSRMSYTETVKFNNYFSPEFIEKELTYDFPEGDRIVLVKNRDLLDHNELRMIWSSKLVFENEEFMVYDFDPKKWNDRFYFDRIVKQANEATVELAQGWKSDTTNTWFYYQNYDTVGTDLPEAERLGGKGALKEEKRGWNNILTLKQPDIKAGDYVVRFWFYLKADRPDVTAIVEETYPAADSIKAEWVGQFDVRQSTLIVEDWCLIEMPFSVSSNMEQLNFLITGNGSGEPFIVDELFIHRQNDHPLFRKTVKNGTPYLIYNNYWIKENAFQR